MDVEAKVPDESAGSSAASTHHSTVCSVACVCDEWVKKRLEIAQIAVATQTPTRMKSTKTIDRIVRTIITGP